MAVLTRKNDSGAHWYAADGTPMHTQPRKDGDGVRATTLTDARKLNLYPSVTSILSILAKPGLETWKLRKAVRATLQLPLSPNEDEESWADRVIDLSREEVTEAADTGSDIHHCIDAGLQEQEWDRNYNKQVLPVLMWFHEKNAEIIATEKTLVNTMYGFAGTVDVLFMMEGVPCVGDYKTRKTKGEKIVKAYDGQGEQLAAYGSTFWPGSTSYRAFNFFISTDEPGRLDVVEHDRIGDKWDAFIHCCRLWQHFKGYCPGEQRA